MRRLRTAWLKQQCEVKANRAAWELGQSADLKTWETISYHREYHQWEVNADLEARRLTKDSNIAINIVWIG